MGVRVLIRYRIVESGDDLARYHRLRTDVYLDTGLITEADIDPTSGLYVDRYDDHSVQLLATNDDDLDVGCWRMIESGPGRTLPISDLFDIEVTPNSYESSSSAILPAYRKTQVGLGFFRAMLEISEDRGLGDTYGIVEQPYLDFVRAIGIPVDVLGEPRFVFNADNVPIVIWRQELMAVLDAVGPTAPPFVDYFLKPFNWSLAVEDAAPPP
jgi:N-acyl-L-homoserine lactone synthetase